MILSLITLRPSLLAYQTEVVIEGVTLILDVEYRARTNDWFLSVYDVALSPIVEGVRVNSNTDLFRGLRDSRMPDGVFIALSAPEITTPRIGQLGDAAKLYFASQDAIDALREADADGWRALITPQAIKSVTPVVP